MYTWYSGRVYYGTMNVFMIERSNPGETGIYTLCKLNNDYGRSGR